MSALRLGTNPDGTRHVLELEPATARRAGFGGSALGHFQGIILTVSRKPAGSADPAAAQKHRRSV